MSDTVQKDRVVAFYYVLRGDDGNVIDASSAEPMTYLHGHGQLVAGLEAALVGHRAGEQLQVVVEPEQGYGVYSAKAFQKVKRSDFPRGANLEVGTAFRTEGSDGKAVVLWIHEAKGAWVTLTTNHPLAGKRLHFQVNLANVREATPDELSHGHAHGPGGHAH
jgi:FKBP-type peptidyl-prolyl cis-trans isomerase SlyD